MKYKTLIWIVVFVALIGVIPIALRRYVAIVQEQMNPVLRKPPYTISEEAAKLHASLTIADLHSDALLWGTDLTRRNKVGHVDIPRLIEGNVALQVFSVVTKVPEEEKYGGYDVETDTISKLVKADLWPPRTWSSLNERALYQASQLRKFQDRSNGRLTVVASQKDLEEFLVRRRSNPNMTAGMLSLEGAHALDRDLENIDKFFEAGFRIVGLVHFFNNEIGGASLDTGDQGLSEFGRVAVKRLEQIGLIIDLAHASPQLIEDVLDATTGPIIVTHTGIDAICPNKRNLSDSQIRRIVERAGLIGIGYDPLFNCAPGVKAIVHSIRYVADHFGVEHVALGSDYDGVIQAPFDTSGIALITQELINNGFTPEEIRKIMGENVVNFLLQHLPQE